MYREFILLLKPKVIHKTKFVYFWNESSATFNWRFHRQSGKYKNLTLTLTFSIQQTLFNLGVESLNLNHTNTNKLNMTKIKQIS